MRGGGYETSDDMRREGEIVSLIEQRWKCGAQKLKVSYKLDYALTRVMPGPQQSSERIVAFCEIKTRKLPWEAIDRIGGFMISMDKWLTAQHLSSMASVPFVLAVSCDGDLRYICTEDFSHDGVIWQGRGDRGDAGDYEPHVLLAVKRFRAL